MNILLTGGAGYIGSHTAVALLDAGHQVLLFDNLSNSKKSVIGHLEKITNKTVSFVEGDVRDKQIVSKTIQDYRVDAVIHFAGLKAVGESMENPLKYYDNNVGGTISLLQAMMENNVKSIVFSSSATVYGLPHYLPYDENHPTAAINPYGQTKLYAEEILKDIVDSDPDWSVSILRYFNPIGAHESGLIGELPNGVPNNLMPYIVQVATGRLKKLKVFGNDYLTSDGTGERDYVHVMDLAEGHVSALNYLFRDKGLNIINLGTGRSTSVLELIETFERVTGQRIPIEIAGRRPGDLPSYYAQVEKASHLLKWKAKRDIDAMCLSSWRWGQACES